MSQFADLAALTIHDVKNRLALVAARAEANGDAETLRGVLEAAAQLTDLLAWYRAEHDRLRVDIDARVPADLIEELSASLRRQTALEIVAESEAAPELAFYDETLVRMVVLDALYNAVRHARSRIVLRAGSDNGWLVFAVADDGPGYPPAILAEPVAMQPITRQGTGLGLHLAARIAALHENQGQTGRIELNNDGGAVFRLFLPL